MREALAFEGNRVETKRFRADKGTVRLTERDLAALRWVGEQYAVRFDQLSRLLGRDVGRSLSDSTTRAAVTRWVRAGLAKTRKVTVRDPAFVWLTRRGLREVDLDFKAWEPAASSTAHLFWTNQVRLYTEERHPDATWRSERRLRKGGAMQTLSDSDGHVADGEVHLPHGVVGIEVELTSKSVNRRNTIMELLVRRYGTIWYFAPQGVLGCLEQTADSLAASRERVLIYPLERVA